jgi:hypothetical protein
MNWPGPVEFTFLVFLSLFFSWIKAVLCIAAAILIRNRWASMVVAAFIGVAETAVDAGIGLFFTLLLDLNNDLFLALAAFAALLWWGIGRAFRTIWIFATRRNAA